MIIAAVVYLAIVVVRCLEAVHQYNSNLYILNMEYCKTNFIILSFVLIGILLNTMVLFLSDNETQQKKPIKTISFFLYYLMSMYFLSLFSSTLGTVI